MGDDALPYEPKPENELTFPKIEVCQKWIPHEFDIVTMLAKNGLSCPVFALAKLCRKKKAGEKMRERLKSIIDCPVPKGPCSFLLCECGGRNFLRGISQKEIPRPFLRISVRLHISAESPCESRMLGLFAARL
jgi:hypothetical protein